MFLPGPTCLPFHSNVKNFNAIDSFFQGNVAGIEPEDVVYEYDESHSIDILW